MRALVLIFLGLAAATSPSGVGKPCRGNQDCPTGYCITTPEYPGGYCSKRDCQTGGCPTDSDCSGGGKIGSEGCFLRCQRHSDCRSGYHCCPDRQKVKVCVPAKGCGLSC